MNSVNFIPMQRRHSMQVQRRLHAWTIGVVGYTILALVSYTAWAFVAAGEDQQVEQKLQRLPQEIEQAQTRIDALRKQLADVNVKLDTIRSIAEQPDWSILLAAVADAAGEDLALSDCRLRPAETPAIPPRSSKAAPTSRPAGGFRYTMQLNGIARSQTAVSQFVLRLEQMQLFDRVNLLKTSRETLGDENAIIFQLDASISGEGGVGR